MAAPSPPAPRSRQRTADGRRDRTNRTADHAGHRRRCDTPAVQSAVVTVQGLSPVQQRTLAALRRDQDDGRPVAGLDPPFVAELVDQADDALAALGVELGHATLLVTKHRWRRCWPARRTTSRPTTSRGRRPGAGAGLAPGDPAPAQLAGRADARRAGRRGDGPARPTRSAASATTSPGSVHGRRRRPARAGGRAGHQVPRVLPAARPTLAPDDRGRRAVPGRRADRAAGSRRPGHRRAGRAARAAR